MEGRRGRRGGRPWPRHLRWRHEQRSPRGSPERRRPRHLLPGRRHRGHRRRGAAPRLRRGGRRGPGRRGRPARGRDREPPRAPSTPPASWADPSARSWGGSGADVVGTQPPPSVGAVWLTGLVALALVLAARDLAHLPARRHHRARGRARGRRAAERSAALRHPAALGHLGPDRLPGPADRAGHGGHGRRRVRRSGAARTRRARLLLARATPSPPCGWRCCCSALLLLQIRNFYGLYAVLVAGAGVLAVSWWADERVQSLVAYTGTWFLLLAAPRPVLELQHQRRGGRARTSDADTLARLTRVPGLRLGRLLRSSSRWAAWPWAHGSSSRPPAEALPSRPGLLSRACDSECTTPTSPTPAAPTLLGRSTRRDRAGRRPGRCRACHRDGPLVPDGARSAARRSRCSRATRRSASSPAMTERSAQPAGHRRRPTATRACWRRSSRRSTCSPAAGRCSGIGAAWYEREHPGLGVPFPPIGGAVRAARGDAADLPPDVERRRRPLRGEALPARRDRLRAAAAAAARGRRC